MRHGPLYHRIEPAFALDKIFLCLNNSFHLVKSIHKTIDSLSFFEKTLLLQYARIVQKRIDLNIFLRKLSRPYKSSGIEPLGKNKCAVAYAYRVPC